MTSSCESPRNRLERGPLVSVIICTFNRASLVPQAISSVQNQTYSNIEIIVIDDASADNTEEVVNAIPDERIQYVRHEENKGPAAGRNTGIRAAKGEYIGFLDDDDQWREDKLEKQLHVIKNHDAVLCDSLWNGRLRRLHMRPTVSLDDLREGTFALPTLLAKAKVLREVLFDESLWQGEDWDVFIRIAQRHSLGKVVGIDPGERFRGQDSVDLGIGQRRRRERLLPTFGHRG